MWIFSFFPSNIPCALFTKTTTRMPINIKADWGDIVDLRTTVKKFKKNHKHKMLSISKSMIFSWSAEQTKKIHKYNPWTWKLFDLMLKFLMIRCFLYLHSFVWWSLNFSWFWIKSTTNNDKKKTKRKNIKQKKREKRN